MTFQSEDRNVFISDPVGGVYYIAERSRKGSAKLLWSVMPVEPIAADTRVDADDVPRQIRRQAYRMFYADKQRGGM